MASIVERNGIIAAGNWIVDHIKIIDVFPVQDSLSNIKEEYLNNGGAPFNVLKNLSKMGAQFPLKAIGVIGNDSYGQWIKKECGKNKIEISNLHVVKKVPTSYTDVMTVELTGRRTFFHQRGANALLDKEYFNFNNSREKMFHLGYLLLLDKLDELDETGMTGAANILRSAQNSGLKTSIDIVSENSDRFQKVVIPALPFVDYLFINEFETERTTGIKLEENFPELDALRKAASMLFSYGVKEWVFIHFPLGVYALNKNGEEIIQGAVQIPKDKIKSTVGAGDAFASGVLYALHENWKIEDTLQLAVSVAATSLFDVSCSDSIVAIKECLKIGDNYSYYISG